MRVDYESAPGSRVLFYRVELGAFPIDSHQKAVNHRLGVSRIELPVCEVMFSTLNDCFLAILLEGKCTAKNSFPKVSTGEAYIVHLVVVCSSCEGGEKAINQITYPRSRRNRNYTHFLPRIERKWNTVKWISVELFLPFLLAAVERSSSLEIIVHRIAPMNSEANAYAAAAATERGKNKS